MSVVALATWPARVIVGLFLPAIWLIEYDRDYQGRPRLVCPCQ